MNIKAIDLITGVCMLDEINKKKNIPDAIIQQKTKEVFTDDFIKKITENVLQKIADMEV